MIRIAKMSKKEAAIYLLCITLFFLTSLCLLITGMIFFGAEPKRDGAVNLLIIGGVLMFLTLFGIMLTTISSNYVEKRLKDKSDSEHRS